MHEIHNFCFDLMGDIFCLVYLIHILCGRNHVATHFYLYIFWFHLWIALECPLNILRSIFILLYSHFLLNSFISLQSFVLYVFLFVHRQPREISHSGSCPQAPLTTGKHPGSLSTGLGKRATYVVTHLYTCLLVLLLLHVCIVEVCLPVMQT